MTVLISAVAFLVLLTVLILIHEWGHYTAARKLGVVVEEFGFGLPPRAKTLFVKNGTLFTLNWVPFGGFVRMKGENAITERVRSSKGSFCAASIPARITILVAGVFMNFILALALLTFGFSYGEWIPTYLTLEDMEAGAQQGEIHLQLGVQIAEVVGGGAAARAGVPTGSLITAVDGTPVFKSTSVTRLQEGKRRVKYTIVTEAGEGETQEYSLILQEGMAGVELVPFPLELSAPRRNVADAFLLAVRESRVMTAQTILAIGKLFTSIASTGTVPEGVTGIVGIAQLTHASVQQGFMSYIRLAALLSLSLAVLNVLPFPALDGGRLLFVFAEVVRRRPLNRRFELIVNAFGFMFLIVLILFITFYDIVRLF